MFLIAICFFLNILHTCVTSEFRNFEAKTIQNISILEIPEMGSHILQRDPV